MRFVSFLVSANYATGQFLPNGMPVPPHLLENMKKELAGTTDDTAQTAEERPPSYRTGNTEYADLTSYDDGNKDYYQNFQKENNYYENYASENNYYENADIDDFNQFSEMLSFEEPTLTLDDFVFDEKSDPIERSRAHYFDGMEKEDKMETITLDLTTGNTNQTMSAHPQRGTFSLEAALKDSRDKGYGSAVRLRFAGAANLDDVDPIYLCSKRSGDQCCVDKDPECFTPGGCFCDSSCRAFDDCCPDFEDHCADKSCLENLKTDIVVNYLRNLRRKPDNFKDLPSIASGGQPKHVEPNACCAGRPYNHGLRCCCAGSVTDECPCKSET